MLDYWHIIQHNIKHFSLVPKFWERVDTCIFLPGQLNTVLKLKKGNTAI